MSERKLNPSIPWEPLTPFVFTRMAGLIRQAFCLAGKTLLPWFPPSYLRQRAWIQNYVKTVCWYSPLLFASSQGSVAWSIFPFTTLNDHWIWQGDEWARGMIKKNPCVDMSVRHKRFLHCTVSIYLRGLLKVFLINLKNKKAHHYMKKKE